MDRRHYIGAAKEFAATVIIVFEVVIKMERLPRLNSNDSVDAPTVRKFLHPCRVWKFINKIPCQPFANVKIRIPAIETNRRTAVIWLGCVGNEVLSIACVVNRMRPCVIQGRGHSVPTVDAQTSLQSVVEIGR